MPAPRALRASPLWTFVARFRRGAFGWKSNLAIQRLDEAAAEIRAIVRKDPAPGPRTVRAGGNQANVGGELGGLAEATQT